MAHSAPSKWNPLMSSNQRRPTIFKFRGNVIIWVLVWTITVFTLKYYLRADMMPKLVPLPSTSRSLFTSPADVPPDVAIIVPFSVKDFPKVLAVIKSWAHHGDPCPKLRTLKNPPLHVLFWFNRDLEDRAWHDLAQHTRIQMKQALQPVIQCLGSVRFESANLTEEQDLYPSLRWYKLYLSPNSPIRLYDYFLWAEHNLTPVRGGWMDALLEEVVRHREFFMRGSINRGSRLDVAAKESHAASWSTHINGNAIFTCQDETFRAMVEACYMKIANMSKSPLTSFDVAVWMEYVTSYMVTLHNYQGYAHKFQYTDFMQHYGKDLSEDEIVKIFIASPGTYMVHGASESTVDEHRHNLFYGQEHVVWTESTTDKETQSVASDRLAVVVPLIRAQIQKMVVLLDIANQIEFKPCSSRLGIDLVLYTSQTWTPEPKHEMQTLLNERGRFTSCFRDIVWAGAHISDDEDRHTTTDFRGPNLHFRRIMNDSYLRGNYDAIFILEPDTTPIRQNWLVALLDLVRKNQEPFWIRGSAYRGFREDWLRNGFGSQSTSIWTAMNGNALYWLQDARFFLFLERVWEKYPNAPYDIAIFSFLHNLENFRHTKIALSRIHYTDYIQNFGGTPFDIDVIRRDHPGTYLIHSSCREEFPARHLYCYVCDVDERWSDECQIKLGSADINLGYDRFITGPTYRGITIDQAHEAQLAAEGIMV